MIAKKNYHKFIIKLYGLDIEIPCRYTPGHPGSFNPYDGGTPPEGADFDYEGTAWVLDNLGNRIAQLDFDEFMDKDGEYVEGEIEKIVLDVE